MTGAEAGAGAEAEAETGAFKREKGEPPEADRLLLLGDKCSDGCPLLVRTACSRSEIAEADTTDGENCCL